MKVRIAIVTNQGVPIHSVLVPSKRVEQAIVDKLRYCWRLDAQKEFQVLARPIVSLSAYSSDTSVEVKRVLSYVDDVKNTKYMLTLVSVEVPEELSIQVPASDWKFCPDCGCSWLSHLEGQASLEPSDWCPRACSECGCKKAILP